MLNAELQKHREGRTHRRIVHAWCLYDWANSAFATTIMAALLPPFYKTVAGVGLPGNRATVYWGYTTSIALFLIALLAPILGAIADYTGWKKRFLAAFTALGIVFTCLLIFVGTGDVLLASVVFIVANVGFAGGEVFYNALLPYVAGPGEIDQISAKGYALGYLGGGLLLAINVIWILTPKTFLLPDPTAAIRLSFISAGLWWALFSIPILRVVPEPSVPGASKSHPHWITEGFRQLHRTLREIRRYSELAMFLLAFWIYNDGIGTIIKMATIYGTEIGIGQTNLIGALLVTQFVGIPCSLLFGRLAARIGAKSSIYLGLSVYALIAVWAYFMVHAWTFWVLAFLVGCVQGGTQALSRSLFGALVPKDRTAEFFGFYSVSAKFAGIAGPFLFALVGQITGSSRVSILSLIVFFIAGGLILARVDEEAGRRRVNALG